MKLRISVGKGIDNYIDELTHLDAATDDILGKAVYEGAKIVIGQVKSNLDALKTDDRPGIVDKRQGIKSIQKTGLQNSLGIAKHRIEGGYYNVKIGFDGYNGMKTDKYPNGQPNAMIARTAESGNSFTKKTPFVGPAIRATKDTAERKMAEVVDLEIKKKMN